MCAFKTSSGIRNFPERSAPFALWLILASALFFLSLTACGGGGGGGNGGPPPPADFELSVSPSSQSVDAGSSATVTLSATALNGFSGQVAVAVTGLPSGLTLSPSSITLSPGTPLQITLTAAAKTANFNGTLTFTGTSGSLTHSVPLSLTVKGSSGPLPTRTSYLRTDATTEYFGWINQHWIIYHTATNRYFVTDPFSNQIIVIDATTQSAIARIGVPGAYGIDDTPDHSTLYVGTLIGDVYSIDPVGMAVIQRYIASQIGPYGYLAFSALGLANGQIALLGAQGGIPSVDGSTSVAIWNPTDNSITIFGGDYAAETSPLPCGPSMGNIGGFTRTPDRTKVLVGSIDSDGTLCEFDPTTGQGVYGGTVGPFAPSTQIVTSPDGNYIILRAYAGDAVLYSAQTLDVVTQFSVLGDTSSAAGFLVSPDSSTLFTPTDNIVYAYSLSTQQLVGWVPNIFVPPTSGGGAVGPTNSPYLQATDGTGLYAGPLEEGVGFIDLSSLQTGAVGTQFTNAYLSPATGPTSGGTVTGWGAQAGEFESVYFGANQASSISYSGGNVQATTPAGPAGPAPVYAFTTNGGMQLIPDGFSYGPTILEVTPTMATAEGGGTGYIYGYGFGPTSSGTVPSGLTVTVNGISVPITAFNGNAYGLASPPYPLESIAYTIPPGVSGTSVNVVVSTTSGSATATGAFSYLPATQQFSLASSQLAQGIYDSYTGLYYFTDTNQLQVFSRTQESWLTPIPIPAPPGTTQRLWGIALSPDGTKMAVADLSAGAIYVLDPTQPASVQTFIVGSQSPFLVNPCGLAISDEGNVYYMVEVLGQGGGADQFFKLNTSNGTIYNYGIDGPGLGTNDAYLRNAISADNARVFFNEDGLVFSVDTATDDLFFAPDGDGCCYGNDELALASNQTQLTATFYIYDSNLDGDSYYELNDREILNIQYVYGAKLSPDGRLLFQPSTNGIDVFDGNLGNLRTRISLPVPLSPNYDALVADGVDNVMIAITGNRGNGIAIVDLTSLPEPNGSLRRHEFATRTARTEAGLAANSHRPEHVQRNRRFTMKRVPHVTRNRFIARSTSSVELF